MITNETTTCMAERRNSTCEVQIPTHAKLSQIFTAFKAGSEGTVGLEKSRSHSCNITPPEERSFPPLENAQFSSTKLLVEGDEESMCLCVCSLIVGVADLSAIILFECLRDYMSECLRDYLSECLRDYPSDCLRDYLSECLRDYPSDWMNTSLCDCLSDDSHP